MQLQRIKWKMGKQNRGREGEKNGKNPFDCVDFDRSCYLLFIN